MKTFRTASRLIVIILCALFCYSCKSTEDKLIGTWELVKESNEDDGTVSYFDDYSDTQDRIIFRKNGLFAAMTIDRIDSPQWRKVFESPWSIVSGVLEGESFDEYVDAQDAKKYDRIVWEDYGYNFIQSVNSKTLILKKGYTTYTYNKLDDK